MVLGAVRRGWLEGTALSSDKGCEDACSYVCHPRRRERELEVGAGHKTLSSFPSDSLPGLHFLRSVSLGEYIPSSPDGSRPVSQER